MNNKYKIVKKYIDEYDYYALLQEGAPDDEFSSEALMISNAISEDSTADQIASIIADIFHFAFKNEEQPEPYLEVAQKIWSELHSQA